MDITNTETELPITTRFTFFTWLLIGLIVLIVALVAVNLLLGVIKAISLAPISGASGTLLYASHFESHPEEWSSLQGQMSSQIAADGLHISINTADGAFSVLNDSFKDFDVRVNVTRLSADDLYNEVGVLFHEIDPANYYMFKIRGDGFYRVERIKDKVVEALSEWHDSPAVLGGLNIVNQLRIVGKGDVYTFYINDQALTFCPNGPGTQKSTWNGDQCMSNNGQTTADLHDDSFSTGKIGVGVYVNEPSAEVVFNDVVIYQP